MTDSFLDFKEVNEAYWDVHDPDVVLALSTWRKKGSPRSSFSCSAARTGLRHGRVTLSDWHLSPDDVVVLETPQSNDHSIAERKNADEVQDRQEENHKRQLKGGGGGGGDAAVVTFFPSPAVASPREPGSPSSKWATNLSIMMATAGEEEFGLEDGDVLSPHLHYPPELADSLPLDYRDERQVFEAGWEALRQHLTPSPEEQASLFAKYFFTWLNPTITLASNEALEEHLFPIPRRDHRARMSGSRLSADFRQREMLDGRLLWASYIEHVLPRPESPTSLDSSSVSSSPSLLVVPNEWSEVIFHGEPWVRGRLRWVGAVRCCDAPERLYAGVEWNNEVDVPSYRRALENAGWGSRLAAHTTAIATTGIGTGTGTATLTPSITPDERARESRSGLLHRGVVHGEQLFYQAAEAAPPRCSLEPVESIVLLNEEKPNVLRAGVRYGKGNTPRRPRVPNLMWSLLRTFRSELLSILPGAAVQLLCFNIASPILIRWYVEFLQDDGASVVYGVAVALVFLLVKGVEPLGSNKFEQRTERTAALFRTATLSLLFEKCMTITTDSFAQREISAGRVLTMASSDVENIKEFPIDAIHIIMAPAILVFCLGNMLYLMGWSALGGVVSIALLLPVQMALVKWQEGLQKRGAAETDQRLRKTNELLSGIRVVKMMGWERNFIASIEAAREQELYYRKWMQYAECCVALAIDGTSISVLMLVISIHYLSGRELTPQVALPMIAMMGSLMYGLMMFPTAVNTIVKFMVSCRRVTQFLSCDDAKRAVENIEDFFPPAAPVGQECSPRRPGRCGGIFDGEGVEECEPHDGPGSWKPPCGGEPAPPELAARFDKATIMAMVSTLVVPLSARPTRVPRMLRRWIPPSSTRLPVELQWVEGAPLSVPAARSSSGGGDTDKTAASSGTAKKKVQLSDEDCAPEDEEDDERSGERTQTVLSAKVLLRRLSLDVPRKGLTVVVGPTGSGKSVLLQSLLDALEIAKDGGRVWATRHIAYVPQQPWIMQDSIRFNITFFDGMEAVRGGVRSSVAKTTAGSDDDARLDRAVRSCQLAEDLKEMPRGLDSEIGERGVNLSGGQKARVSLARAVYADRELYLLDDPLSALDAHVGDRILHEVVLGVLREKAVVLVTHQLQCLPYADRVVVMKDGEIGFSGTYAAYCGSSWQEELERLLPAAEKKTTMRRTSSADGSRGLTDGSPEEAVADCIDDLVTSPIAPFPAAAAEGEGEGEVEPGMAHGATCGPRVLPSGAARSVHSEKCSAASLSLNTVDGGGLSRQLTGDPAAEMSCAVGPDIPIPAAGLHAGDGGRGGGWMTEEEKEQGSVPLRVYRGYVSSGGGVLAFALMCGTFVGFNVFFLLASTWLSLWSANVFPSLSNGQALLVYLLLQGVCLVFSPLSKFCMFRLNLRASREMHGALLRSVASGTLGFFDAVPLGRILNRFSKDMYVLDDELPQHFLMLLDIGFFAASTLVLAVVAMPRSGVVVGVATVVFVLLLRYYARIIREVRRRGSIAESPMFSLLESLLNGGRETLSAYGKSRFAFEEALSRLDRLYSCMYVERAMDQWLNIRVEYLGGLIMFSVTCIGIYQKLRSPDGRMPGETLALISLSLTMCVDLFWSLPLIVKVSAWTEASMNSVQRITHYVERIDHEDLLSAAEDDAAECDDEAENNNNRGFHGGVVVGCRDDSVVACGAADGAAVSPPSPSSSSPMLVFERVCMRYRAGLPYVLRDVSFRIGAREKVGIVGRTGSGKSTLLLTFMRLVEISEGCIYVLGRRASDYSLPALRRQFALIPQDPVLFEGTVRSNLDPFGRCSEAALCRVLELIGLTPEARAGAEPAAEPCVQCDDEALTSVGNGVAVEVGPHRVTLDTVVAEGGKNFSVGQRQLLCMGRALLKKGNQFVLMDEATANVDAALDERIQRVVHTSFAPYVVVTIAHRLHTVASYDRIIVLHRGRVVEQGAPAALIQQPSSQLRRMVVRSATGPSTPLSQRDALVDEAVRKFAQRCATSRSGQG